MRQRLQGIAASFLILMGSSCVNPPAPGSNNAARGIDELTPRERRDLDRLTRDLPAPCPDVSLSLDECLRQGAGCAACRPGLRLLIKQVRDGRSIEQASTAYRVRFPKDPPKPIDTFNAPSLGPSNAPVTVVEYADFQCPFCSTTVAVLDALVKDHAPNVRVVFKHYPIPGHTLAEPAARAASAAGRQGRFWEMHHKLFENQRALQQQDIEQYARELRLDMDRFRTDWASAEIAAGVKRDHDEGGRIGVNGTPTLFINGRRFDLDLFDLHSDLTLWVESEIEIAGGSRPATTAPAAPSSQPSVIVPAEASSAAPASSAPPAPATSASGM